MKLLPEFCSVYVRSNFTGSTFAFQSKSFPGPCITSFLGSSFELFVVVEVVEHPDKAETKTTVPNIFNNVFLIYYPLFPFIK